MPPSVEDKVNKFYLPTIFAQAVIGGGMIAVQLLLCSCSLYVYLRKPKDNARARGIYIAMSFLIFLLDAFQRIGYMKFIYDLLVKPTSAPEVLELFDQLWQTWYMAAGSWVADINLCLCDGLLVYRCFVVWTGRRVVVLLPAVLYLGFVAVIFWSGVASTGSTPVPPALMEAYVALSAAVNCTVTLLITWRLLHMQRLQTIIMGRYRSKVYLNVIGMVSESALLLALCGIFKAICYRQTNSHPTAWKAWKVSENVSTILWDIASVLAPQLIIWRVTLGQSFVTKPSEPSVSTIKFRGNSGSDSNVSEPSKLDNGPSIN